MRSVNAKQERTAVRTIRAHENDSVLILAHWTHAMPKAPISASIAMLPKNIRLPGKPENRLDIFVENGRLVNG